MALNEKQQRFVEEYLIDLNATQAAIRSGYSERTAYSMGQRLLKKVEVQKLLQERKQDRAERTEITQDMVLKELAMIAFSNAADYAKVIEKDATIEIEGRLMQLFDENGNPVKYRTVEPVLTEELSEEQKKALAVIKKGKDGFEVKPYDKVRALELLGKHLGMFTDKLDINSDVDMELNINIDYGDGED